MLVARELCQRLNMGDFASTLESMTSPTKELLVMYEVMHSLGQLVVPFGENTLVACAYMCACSNAVPSPGIRWMYCRPEAGTCGDAQDGCS